jgi:hypothetical protein
MIQFLKRVTAISGWHRCSRSRRKRKQTLGLESLESRILMTATGWEMTPLSVQFAQRMVDGTLLLQAPNTANHVTVNGTGETVNVQWTGLGAKTFSGVSRVSFLGGNAADSLVADQTFSLPITAWGNGGDDRFIGGAAADTFFGGVGADFLDGQGGDDILWSRSPSFPIGSESSEIEVHPGLLWVEAEATAVEKIAVLKC